MTKLLDMKVNILEHVVAEQENLDVKNPKDLFKVPPYIHLQKSSI